MKTRIGAVGIAVLATLGLALTGCGPDTGTGKQSAASPSPTLAAPKDALAAGVAKLAQTSYAFTVTQKDMSGQGKADPANKAAQVSINSTGTSGGFKIGVIVVAPDYWIQVDLGPEIDRMAKIDPKAWMHIDTSKVTNKDALPADPSSPDLFDFSTMSDGLVNVERVDADHYRGTIDLTAVKGAAEPDKDVKQKVGDKAKSVPFTATLDDQGRLTEFKIDGSGINDALSLDMTFSDFGAAQNISKPTGTITEAPSSVYNIFNS
ncbi:MAG TPA: hypothetical protein VF054_12320 [Micromonosporaceae bacterium]